MLLTPNLTPRGGKSLEAWLFRQGRIPTPSLLKQEVVHKATDKKKSKITS